MTRVGDGFARGACAIARMAALMLLLLPLASSDARAQWVTTHEQFYLQAKHNWQFRHRYQAADRLFNAFDFGHAILYETLWSRPSAPPSELEQKWYDRLTKEILVHPPRVPLEEAAIEIAYARLVPEAKAMFEWAHILHRQTYDVLSDERLSDEQKDAEVARLLAYYRTRSDLAFSSRPKSMALMQEQPYSLAFRQGYPRFNGLIWAYHWLQVGLYEPLMVNATTATRQAGVRATVARFWQMLEEPPSKMPHVMPMTAAVAPKFSARYPEAAIIFDNLHSMHDVVSDILANPSVPRDRKRAELMLAARRFRDDTSYVMSVEAWRTMAQHMGVENMGGPAVDFLTALPTPTVTYGAVMTHDDRTGAMTGFKYGQAVGGEHAGMQHGAGAMANMPATPRADSGRASVTDSAAGRMDHAAMGHDTTASPEMREMMELHALMMRDPVIRQRVMADTAMRRRMAAVMGDSAMGAMPERATPAKRPAATPTRQARPRSAQPARTTRPTQPKPQVKKDSVAADPHRGHGAPPPKP